MAKAKTVKEVLIAAKYILNHLGWTQDVSYRDSDDRPTTKMVVKNGDWILNQEIKSACLSGALDLVEKEDSLLASRAFGTIHSLLNGDNITSFNDERYRTKKEVLNLLDKAIEGLKE